MVATPLQHDQAPRLNRIQATSTRGVRTYVRRVAGCATPTGSVGHASATTNLKLIFHLNHSVGAITTPRREFAAAQSGRRPDPRQNDAAGADPPQTMTPARGREMIDAAQIFSVAAQVHRHSTGHVTNQRDCARPLGSADPERPAERIIFRCGIDPNEPVVERRSYLCTSSARRAGTSAQYRS